MEASSSRPVSISTGSDSKPGRSRNWAQVWNPSRPGIRASSTTTSGSQSARMPIARSPLLASVIEKPRSRSAMEVSSRLTSSSSTSSTFCCSGSSSSTALGWAFMHAPSATGQWRPGATSSSWSSASSWAGRSSRSSSRIADSTCAHSCDRRNAPMLAEDDLIVCATRRTAAQSSPARATFNCGRRRATEVWNAASTRSRSWFLPVGSSSFKRASAAASSTASGADGDAAAAPAPGGAAGSGRSAGASGRRCRFSMASSWLRRYGLAR